MNTYDNTNENAELRIGHQEAAQEAMVHREYCEERARIEDARLARKLARARCRPSIVLPPEPAPQFSDEDEWT